MTKKLRENFFILFTSNLCTLSLVLLVILVICQANPSGMSSIQTTYLFSLPTLLSVLICVFVICVSFATLKTKETSDIVINNNIGNAEARNTTVISDRTEDLREQYKSEQECLENAIYRTVCEYTIDVLSPYLDDEEIEKLCQNIRLFDIPGSCISTIKSNGDLSTLDFRHYAWNIGERLGWSGQKRATFIKLCFTEELKEMEIETIRRTLRHQQGRYVIEIDVPDKNTYGFHNNVVKIK